MSDTNFLKEIPCIADLHIHTTLKPMRQKPEKNIWEFIDMKDECKDMDGLLAEEDELSSRAGLDTFSQGNLEDCLKNNVRLLGLAFYPPEVNYFDIRNLARFFIRLLGKEKKLARCISNFHPDIAEKYLHIIDDNLALPYFDDLEAEYQYTLEQSQIQHEGKTFKIASNFEDIEAGLQDANTVVGFITIEGMHSLVNHASFKILKTEARTFNDTHSAEFIEYHRQYTEHIKKVKAWGNGKHAPLFISFTHHFWNFLCGQARSMEGAISKFVLNQNHEMDSDFTELGKQVVQMLLDRSNGRRILIDIKHMSARSRIHFYKIWKDFVAQDDPFPIICSHSAVNGVSSLEDSRGDIDNHDKMRGEYFNTWSINLCDEDIEVIFRSKGIIGMILHEGRLPGAISQERIKAFKKDDQADRMRDEYIRVFMANIFHIIRVCEQKCGKGKEAWDIICMGSDFDGLINAFNVYDNAEDLPKLALHMFQFLNRPLDIPEANFSKADFDALRFAYTPAEIVNKIMYENMAKFLKRYYNDEYLKDGSLAPQVLT